MGPSWPADLIWPDPAKISAALCAIVWSTKPETFSSISPGVCRWHKKNVGAGRASQVSPSPPPGKELTAAAGILVPCGVCHGKRFVAIWYADLCQGSKKVRDPGFAESKVWDLDGSWTLHVLFAVGLWKPRTSKLCYAARPWKPRTSKFW